MPLSDGPTAGHANRWGFIGGRGLAGAVLGQLGPYWPGLHFPDPLRYTLALRAS